MNDISKDKDYQEFFACTEVAFGAGNALLWYGICARCAKQPPVVRDAFSGALGVKNRLFWYRSDIRYRKPPSLVPNRYSCAQNTLLWYAAHFQGPPVRRTASWGTRRVFRGTRCKKQAFLVQE